MHMVALYTVWYNFVKMHKTLRMTPAMASGVSSRLWSRTTLPHWSKRRAQSQRSAGRTKSVQCEIDNVGCDFPRNRMYDRVQSRNATCW
jgi:hypothetical protein